MNRRHLLRSAWLLTFGASLATAAGADEPYPARVVTVEQMKLASGSMAVQLPKNTVRRSKSLHTVVLVSHLSRDGSVLRSRLETSSGSPHLDEAVMRSMRDVRFRPFEVDGAPEAVSLVTPFHLYHEDIARWKWN